MADEPVTLAPALLQSGAPVHARAVPLKKVAVLRSWMLHSGPAPDAAKRRSFECVAHRTCQPDRLTAPGELLP